MAGLESMYPDDDGVYEESGVGGGGGGVTSYAPEVRLRQRRRVHQFEDEEEEQSEDPYAQFQMHRNKSASSPPPASSEEVENYVKLGMGVSGLVLENVICHPFMVLRRTCQVSPADSTKFHCHPFRLLPISVHLYQRQGLSAFYKGLSGCLTVRGLQMAAEDMVSKLTPWPKELDKTQRTSLRRIGQHLALKAASIALTTPFYSASLVETVQSDIACEKPGVFDIFREGLFRLAPGYSGGGRLLPIYLLLPPTVCHGMAHYIVSSGVSAVTNRIMNRQVENKDATSLVKNEQVSNALGHLLADALLYPFETVLHRLHLQGSRTIIDDLDCGTAVVPVMTRYEGFFDCLETIRSEEGVWGFYRGFGGMIVQYAVRLAVLHALSLVAKELANLIMDPVPSPPPIPMVGPPRVRPSIQQQQQFGQQTSAQHLYSQQQRPQYAPYAAGQQELDPFGHQPSSQQLHTSQQELGMPRRQMFQDSPSAGSFSDPVTPNLTSQYKF